MLLAPSVSGLFKWQPFEPEVILLAVAWHLRFPLRTATWRNCWPSKMFTVRQVPAPICRIQEEATAKQCEKILRLE
jgi:hypothetical protein